VKFTTVNPATGEEMVEFEAAGREQVYRAVEEAKRVFEAWRKVSFTQRGKMLFDAADALQKTKRELARTITLEMGKPIRDSLSEVDKCAWGLRYYAENGERFLREEYVTTDTGKSYVAFEPLGVVGSIMPWNYPMWQAIRFGAPALMAGNTVVFKPSSVTPQTGLALQSMLASADLPDGVFQTLLGGSSTAEALLESDVDAVSFTGSVEVGMLVAQKAGAGLKKFVLELGGSDPFIVCGDADVERASKAAVAARFSNCGQSCIAAKRFFIVKDVSKEFTELFVQQTERLKVGDPLDPQTDMGPMVRESALEELDRQIRDAVEKGAEVLTGGERMDRKGFFYKPTVLTNVNTDMAVMKEETFGPVAPIMVVADEREAVRLANTSEFGLGASVWTEDEEKGESLARLLEAGLVTVNGRVASDPRLPFGGVKKSGVGRELSRYGILEFVNIKSVRIYRPCR